MNATVFQSFVAFLATEYECISQIEEFFTTQVLKHGSIPNVQKRPHPIRVGRLCWYSNTLLGYCVKIGMLPEAQSPKLLQPFSGK